MLLSVLITYQFVIFQDDHHKANKLKHLSFFESQLDHRSTIEALPDGISDSFEPLAFYAEQNDNSTLCFGQAMKAYDLACLIKKI